MLNISVPDQTDNLPARIVVFGVGGAGGNAVNNMIRSDLQGVEFAVTNTDAQALEHSLAATKIQLGANITQGLGAGARPDIGRAAAEETMDELMARIEGANMVFITAGMGGGTGTGSAPVIARACRDVGVLTVGVVTKPFHFEGAYRMKLAEQGIQELQEYVDTLIVIPNQNLFLVANERTTFADAFKMADDVLHSGVRGVTDLMVMPGLINLDFNDIRSVMTEMGKAMMGTGEAEGDNRALDAAASAISNPLLDDVSMQGARGVLINITGGLDMTLYEVDAAANHIREQVDSHANIIFGSTFDDSIEGLMRVSVVATGIESEARAETDPASAAANAAAGETAAAPLAFGARTAQAGGTGLYTGRPAGDGNTSRHATAAMPGRTANTASFRAGNGDSPAGGHGNGQGGAAVARSAHAAPAASGAATAEQLDFDASEASPQIQMQEILDSDRRQPAPGAQTGPAPQATAEAGDSFIPPRPVAPGESPAESAAPAGPAAPERPEAGPTAPASPAHETPTTGQNGAGARLWERVKNLGRGKEGPAEVTPIDAGGGERGDAAGESRQAQLGLHPESRPASGTSDDDGDEIELDIPAFLRRQAN